MCNAGLNGMAVDVLAEFFRIFPEPSNGRRGGEGGGAISLQPPDWLGGDMAGLASLLPTAKVSAKKATYILCCCFLVFPKIYFKGTKFRACPVYRMGFPMVGGGDGVTRTLAARGQMWVFPSQSCVLSLQPPPPPPLLVSLETTFFSSSSWRHRRPSLCKFLWLLGACVCFVLASFIVLLFRRLAKCFGFAAQAFIFSFFFFLFKRGLKKESKCQNVLS